MCDISYKAFTPSLFHRHFTRVKCVHEPEAAVTLTLTHAIDNRTNMPVQNREHSEY